MGFERDYTEILKGIYWDFRVNLLDVWKHHTVLGFYRDYTGILEGYSGIFNRNKPYLKLYKKRKRFKKELS